MPDQIQLAAERLDLQSKAWTHEVKAELFNAAFKVDTLKDTTRLEWGLFQIPYNSYVISADYIRERLAEGANEAEEIGTTLRLIVNQFIQQDTDQAHEINRIAELGQ
ncbi:hypothetical protein NLM24_25610 [Nocardia zapadnayensis]|uniref:hypothetical protein n=1 Tax=Nocardia rhamnosiphila TaxID=426716 RepID=UPI0022484B43|nr:hypothetical protein [Nocardia zapadnayensis]MCX0274008.1 hypothetical protein [Nocardia zapadnayensis]